MNTLKYAEILRNGAEVLLNDPHALWWYERVISSSQVFNWVEKQPDLGLDFFQHNEETALLFLFLAAALEAGDLS